VPRVFISNPYRTHDAALVASAATRHDPRRSNRQTLDLRRTGLKLVPISKPWQVDQIGVPCETLGPREFPGFRWTLASCRHTALIKRAFQDVSPKELEQLEGVLKKIGKRRKEKQRSAWMSGEH
jgi:hypothetical protein